MIQFCGGPKLNTLKSAVMLHKPGAENEPGEIDASAGINIRTSSVSCIPNSRCQCT